MLLILRAAAAVTAAVTAVLLLAGDHPVEFIVADTLVVALLTGAAFLPARHGATAALAVAFGVALGVFIVAFTASVGDGTASWPLAAAVLGCLVGIACAGRELVPATQPQV